MSRYRAEVLDWFDAGRVAPEREQRGAARRRHDADAAPTGACSSAS